MNYKPVITGQYYISTAGSYFLQLRIGCYYTKGKSIKLNKLDREQEISLNDELCMYVVVVLASLLQ